MRWRLIRRRLSISAPRMAVRSHLPWPLRWVLAAVMLGFSAALALWAFEFGRSIAGLHVGGRQAGDVIAQLHQQLDEARRDRDAAQSVANSADSLLKAERVTQLRLAEQVKALEAENLALKDDLGFFERLLPASGDGLAIRGLQVEPQGPGQWRFQLLVMQQGARNQPEFKGTVTFQLAGQSRDGRPWAAAVPVFEQSVSFRQYRRIEGRFTSPAGVTAKELQIRVLDESGQARATQSHHL
ncbi:MAG: hypothetical protein QM742_15155 [Aquabacterium sp.]